MSVQTIFEVHTLKGGEWVVDSTYNDKDSAIEVAKSLFGEKRYEGIKVIKDTYDPTTGSGKEFVVYDTSKTPRDPKPVAAPATKEAPAAAAAPKSDVDFKKRAGKQAPVKRSSDISVALKAVFWLVVLLLAGLGALFAVNYAGYGLGKLFG